LNAALLARVRKGFASELFANLIRIVIQVGGVPLYLTFWGTERYGEWLLLTAILGYLRLSNVGFSQATRNRMAMAVSAGDRKEALGYFQSTSMLFMVMGVLVLALALLASTLAGPIHDFLRFQELSAGDLGLALMLLGGVIVIHLQVELVDAGFRAEGHYGLSTFLVMLTELLIFAMIVAVMASGGGLLQGVACYLLGGIVRFFLLRTVLRRYAPWVRFGFGEARWTTVKSFVAPSLAFMAFPHGQAMTLQGSLIVISAILGPAAVVVFNTMRMMSRYAVHLTVIFARIGSPEIAFAYGKGKLGLVQQVHWQICRIGLWTALAACAALAVLTPWILRIWTGGRIEAMPEVYLPLLAAVFLWAAHTLAANVLQATNHHRGYALMFLAVGVSSLALVAFLAHRFGLEGAAFGTLGGEVALLLYVLPRAARFSGGTVWRLLAHVATPPSPSMLRHLKAHAAGG
jgi:O-antigen/teichoic acid export membrane protein